MNAVGNPADLCAICFGTQSGLHTPTSEAKLLQGAVLVSPGLTALENIRLLQLKILSLEAVRNSGVADSPCSQALSLNHQYCAHNQFQLVATVQRPNPCRGAGHHNIPR